MRRYAPLASQARKSCSAPPSWVVIASPEVLLYSPFGVAFAHRIFHAALARPEPCSAPPSWVVIASPEVLLYSPFGVAIANAAKNAREAGVG